jgi:hypothetical protein
MGELLEHLLTYGSLAATAAIAWYAARNLKDLKDLRLWFIVFLLGATSYKNLEPFIHPEELLTPYGVFGIWFRHAVFYAGQFGFFVLINRVIFAGLRPSDPVRRASRLPLALLVIGAAVGLLPHPTHAYHTVDLLAVGVTPYTFMLYLTDQGVQHVIAVVFFLLALGVLYSQSLYPALHLPAAVRRRIITPLATANLCFIAVHVWEFLLESRHVWPTVSEELIEMGEFVFILPGLALLLAGAAIIGRSKVALAAKADAS